MLAIWETVSPFILPFYYLAIFFVVINILLDNHNPPKDPLLFAASTSAPYSRNLYLPVFGQNIRKQKVFAKKQLINTAFGGQGIFNGSGSPFINRYRSQTRLPEGQYGKLIQFLRNDLSPLSLINKVKILKNGESTFPEIFEAVERAKHHIHLEYYIYSEDDIGTELAELLLKKGPIRS